MTVHALLVDMLLLLVAVFILNVLLVIASAVGVVLGIFRRKPGGNDEDWERATWRAKRIRKLAFWLWLGAVIVALLLIIVG